MFFVLYWFETIHAMIDRAVRDGIQMLVSILQIFSSSLTKGQNRLERMDLAKKLPATNAPAYSASSPVTR
jgi:hypothetical protein